MKKTGYPASKAGAIEAVACAGGPLLPPVMGAGAFIMAEMTSSSYATIIQAALLGALIFYIGVLSTVHFEAVKMNLPKVSKDWYVGLKSVLKRLPFLFSLFFMVYLLMSGTAPSKSAVYAFILMLVIWVLAARRNFKWQELINGFAYAAKSGAVIAAALAGSGILVAVVNQTGLATAFSNIIIEYSFGNVWIALFLVMLVTLILGAGLPTTPAYVITVSVAAGALSFFNVPIIGAHLFVFYFAILADVSPPVGVTAFAAAGIAGSPPMKTSVLTTKFAFAGFIVPFVFVANPALLMNEQFSWTTILLTFVITVIGIIGASAVIVGAFFQELSLWKRILLSAITLIIIGGPFYIGLCGVGLLAVFVLWEYKNYSRLKGVISSNNNLVKQGG
jgi:TRAP transporter 4TM/12TM fusion protein